MYINNSTWNVYSCVGLNLWDYQGNIKGDEGEKGDPGDPINQSEYPEETIIDNHDYIVVFKGGQPRIIQWANLKII